MKLKTIIILALVALFIVISVQNTQGVTIRILFWTISMSRIILIPLLLFFGFLVGFLVAQVTKK
jgi:uncharacterized integral membrane protein